MTGSAARPKVSMAGRDTSSLVPGLIKCGLGPTKTPAHFFTGEIPAWLIAGKSKTRKNMNEPHFFIAVKVPEIIFSNDCFSFIQ